jgi:putative heme-binding domain-containing protein
LLREIAGDENNSTAIRAEAITGLAAAAFAPAAKGEAEPALTGLLESSERELRMEAIRGLVPLAAADTEAASALRERAAALVKGGPSNDPRAPIADEAELLAIALAPAGSVSPDLQALRAKRPENVAQWAETLASGGDPLRGRRVFFHSGAAGCYRCHRIDGRGGNIGPDLSVIAASSNRRKLAESILDPSREIAPQFAAWSFVLRSGKVETGVILSEDRSGTVRVGTAEGETRDIAADEVETRVAQKVSLMPDKLIDGFTIEELRDVLAYLETLR